MTKFIETHDQRLDFLIFSIILGVALTLIFNLSFLVILIIIHFWLDYKKFRLLELPPKRSLLKASESVLVDIAFLILALIISVYFHHHAIGFIGIKNLNTLTRVRVFGLVRFLPRVVILENLIKTAFKFKKFRKYRRKDLTYIPSWKPRYTFLSVVSIIGLASIIFSPYLIEINYQQLKEILVEELSPFHLNPHLEYMEANIFKLF